MPFDYKKEYKEFYLPPKTPSIVTVPAMNFLAVRGQGDPNQEDGAYKEALGLLYAVAFTIKMSKLGKHKLEGYFDYVVPPLEGLWWQEGVHGVDYARKADFQWISLIRLPEFVTEEAFHWAVREAAEKKKQDFFQGGVLFLGRGALRPVHAPGPLRRRVRHRGGHGRIRPCPGVSAGLQREPVPSRNLPERRAPLQAGKAENGHPAAGAKGGPAVKGFTREHTEFSLCGLACLLCPMQVGGYCLGCGGGAGNQSCAIARCSLEQGGPEFCSGCAAYPCARYDEFDAADSFVPHSRRAADLARAGEMGLDAWLALLRQKRAVLDKLLADWNDGRRKSLYCAAAYLLEPEALRRVMEALAAQSELAAAPAKERAQAAASLLQTEADRAGISLKLNKGKG